MSEVWIVGKQLIDADEVMQIKTFETLDYKEDITLYGIFFLMEDGKNLAEIFQDEDFRDTRFASMCRDLMGV